jgi:hypothetical protein
MDLQRYLLPVYAVHGEEQRDGDAVGFPEPHVGPPLRRDDVKVRQSLPVI